MYGTFVDDTATFADVTSGVGYYEFEISSGSTHADSNYDPYGYKIEPPPVADLIDLFWPFEVEHWIQSRHAHTRAPPRLNETQMGQPQSDGDWTGPH